MASHPSAGTLAASPISAARRAEILQALVETASAEVNAQLDGFTTRLSEALLRASKNAALKEAKLCASAATLLKQNRYAFFYVASARLSTVLQHEIKAAEHVSPTPGETSGALKSLEPGVEADKNLRLAKTSRAIEGEHAEHLAALGYRLAYLLGRDELTTAQSPFRPQVFLSVLHDAWCEFHPDTGAHHLVFPLLQPDLCLDMAPILHVANTLLIKRGILPELPKSFHIGQSNPDRGAAHQEERDDDAVIRQLRLLFPTDQNAANRSAERPTAGAFPTLFQDDVVQATAARNELLVYLTGVQKSLFDHPASTEAASDPKRTSLLANLKRHAPQKALSQVNESTIDLLTKIFEVVFRDQNIPAEIKALLGSLQVPLLKAALIDKDFFFKQEHPARRVIELLTKLSVGWDSRKGPADPLYQTILRNVKRIQSDQRAPAFAEALAELEAFIEKEETAATEALSAPISQALQQEKLQQATKAAKNEVALRVGTGEVAAFVETFLEDKWVSVLTLAYGVKEEKPQAVTSAIKTMDDLCWSVKPKITLAERKELLAKLPQMVAMLNKWLDLIKWGDAERTRFFAELTACHASIVRAPLELSPQRQVEIAIEVAKRAAERRQQWLARQQPEPVPDEFTNTVQTLERGAWVEFTQKDGVNRKLKLAWVSPMRSLYIFATRERREALSMSDEELARALREQRAQIVSIAGLVGRALTEALGSESANSEVIGGTSAA